MYIDNRPAAAESCCSISYRSTFLATPLMLPFSLAFQTSISNSIIIYYLYNKYILAYKVFIMYKMYMMHKVYMPVTKLNLIQAYVNIYYDAVCYRQLYYCTSITSCCCYITAPSYNIVDTSVDMRVHAYHSSRRPSLP